jgi:hypothetical protein
MVEIRLDAIASSINFVAGIVLAIDALTVPWKTKVIRGWEKFFEGLEKTGDEDLVVDSAGSLAIILNQAKIGPTGVRESWQSLAFCFWPVDLR